MTANRATHRPAIAMLTAGLAASASADIITVGSSSTADHATLDAAIAAASPGDELIVEPGVYRDADGDGVVARLEEKPLTLRAAGAPGSVILEYELLSETGGAIVITAHPEVVLATSRFEGLRIRPDREWDTWEAAPHAAVDTQNQIASFQDCIFENNGGPDFVHAIGPNADLAFHACTFELNGDMELVGGSSTFTDCSFLSNGPIRIDSPTSHSWANDALFRGCTFEEQGTCIDGANRSVIRIDDCDFRNLTGSSAAVDLGTESFTNISNCRFHAAHAESIDINEATVSIIGCLFEGVDPSCTGCEASSRVFVGGDRPLEGGTDYDVMINGCEFRNTYASAVRIESRDEDFRTNRALVTNCTFDAAGTVESGGAVYVMSSFVDVTHCRFENGHAGIAGHAIAIAGDHAGLVRIHDNQFRSHATGDPGAATVQGLGLVDVQCFDNAFCGDSPSGAIGGAAITAWDNLLGGECWENFPLPRGIADMAKATEVLATAVAGLDSDADFAFGGTGHTAIAEAEFDSFPMIADAQSFGTLDASTPTEHGYRFELAGTGHLFASNGGDPVGTSARAGVEFTAWIQVITDEARVLEIDLLSEGGDGQASPWNIFSTTAEVRDSKGLAFAPAESDPASGRWRFELPAQATVTITVNITVSSKVDVDWFEVADEFLDERFSARVEFFGAGGSEDGDEEEEEEGVAGDVNNDGKVNGADLALILSAWGTQNEAFDIDGSGTISGGDLAMVLAGWAP